MPMRLFHTLYIKLVNRLSTDEGQQEADYEEMGELLEEGGV